MANDSDVSEVELSDDETTQTPDFQRTSRLPRPSDHTEASLENVEPYNQQLKSISVSAPANSWQVLHHIQQQIHESPVNNHAYATRRMAIKTFWKL